MAIGLGDVRYGSMTSATTVATNDVVTMAVGQLLVVGVKWEDGARDVVISDPNGNIYTPLTQANNGGGPYGQLFYSVITNATDPTVVVTATFNVAGTPTTTGYARIKTAIVTGCASVPFDRENTANGSSADPAGASVTTRVANEILFCLGAEYGAGIWADAAGGVAWQIIDQDGGTMWAYAIVSSTGTYAAGFTHASMQWTLNLATFADTEVGGGGKATKNTRSFPRGTNLGAFRGMGGKR